MRTVGVEEELFLVDPGTGRIRPVAQQALAARPTGPDDPPLEAELYQQQIEHATQPCTDLDSLRDALVAARTSVTGAAEEAGAQAVAVSTPVLESGPASPTPDERYRTITTEYGAVAREALVCAMHVHVGVEDHEVLPVVNRIRPWLPTLLAVSANSPFYDGADTGHASWRSQIWSRWPSAGPREPFTDRAAYDETTRLLVEWGAALDPGMLYFDVRPGNGLPTVEVRVADVCTDLDDALLVAALARALVATAAREAQDAERDQSWRADLLRAAHWRAAHDGLTGRLVDPTTMGLAPAASVVAGLVDHVREALAESGDEDVVLDLSQRVVRDGGGAGRQRAVLERTGSLRDVVADLADRSRISPLR